MEGADIFWGGSGDRPYLMSGADDKLAKVWDYQTKACVQTLEGHAHNVSAVCFHPEQGWTLLCNGLVVFDDGGELLPDRRAVAPRPVAA